MINYTENFKELDSDLAVIREGKIQCFLRDLEKNGQSDKAIHFLIFLKYFSY